VALEEAGNDTARAPNGAKRAKTGTPFFGYIIAATLVNTDFGDFFHNQIATAWLAFLNAAFSAWAMSTFICAEFVTSAPRRWLLFEFDRKRHEQLIRCTTGNAAFSGRHAGLAKL
jgi:hypothetical protein